MESNGPGHSRRNAIRGRGSGIQQPVHGVQPGHRASQHAFRVSGRLCTHKPLAIYVPRKYVQGEQLGRRRHKIEAIQQHHDEIAIDWNRNYAVIYQWVKGIDAAEACRRGLLDKEGMTRLIQRSNDELSYKGFTVSDSKPQHIIVRPRDDGQLLKNRRGEVQYALVDFELLKRTPAREQSMRARKRQDYLVRQARRFERREQFPSQLTPANIMGVDYVYGQVESTGGALWVVGKDPMLFEYFLPEKWRRTPRTKISSSQQMFKTVTNDNVRVVWRVRAWDKSLTRTPSSTPRHASWPTDTTAPSRSSPSPWNSPAWGSKPRTPAQST